jgi:cytochrome P450
MNAELIKEMLSPEKAMIMEKDKDLYEVFFSIFRKGLFLSENGEWKHRRKLLSNVFNYDFITAHIPMMVDILFRQKLYTCAKRCSKLLKVA